MQQSVARGFQAAGENGGGATGMAFMGMGMNAASNAMAGLQQPTAPTNNVSAPAQGEDPYTKLAELKKLLDTGVITQADFDEAKKKLLGL